MILKNKKGIERNFRILFELDNKDNKYVIYEDINTLNMYGGKMMDNILKPLDEEEFSYINNIIEKICD